MMKDFFDVTVLAVLQGVAEFLPVSSSGHLVVVQHLLEVSEPLRMRLEVFLHAGTLVSIFAFYAARLRAVCVGVVRRERAAWGYVAKLFVSALPALAVYFLFREAIDALVGNVRMVGALLMFTGAVLVGTRYLPRGTREVGVLRALFMGLGQAIALLPGVSRSGMTLAAARGGRVDPERAAEFSFLMSAPLIVGGVLLELGKLFKGGAAGVAADLHWGVMAWGMCLAAVVATGVFYWILKMFHTANLLPSTLSVTTSFLAVYLTFRRSAYFALAYASNDIVLIALWVLASLADTRYLSVVVCFVAFLMNDLYGFINWRRMKERQRA